MFVAVQESANGNESVGSMWIETKIFNDDAKLSDVWEWSCKLSHPEGKLILSKPQNTDTTEDLQNDTQHANTAIALLNECKGLIIDYKLEGENVTLLKDINAVIAQQQ